MRVVAEALAPRTDSESANRLALNIFLRLSLTDLLAFISIGWPLVRAAFTEDEEGVRRRTQRGDRDHPFFRQKHSKGRRLKSQADPSKEREITKRYGEL